MQSFTRPPHFLRLWTWGRREVISQSVQIPIRIRLILAPALVVLASLVAYAASEVSDARTRVKAETESGLSLSRMVIASALARADESGDPNTAIVQLENELKPVVRHVTIKIEGDSFSYDETTTVEHAKTADLILHTDRNTMKRVG